MLDIYERVLGQAKPDPAALVASLPARRGRVRPRPVVQRQRAKRRRLAGTRR